MKIVFISPAFYPSIGGVETHVLALSRELIKRGHRVTIVTEQKALNWQTNGESDNEPVKLKSIAESSYFKHSRLDQIDIYYFKFGQPSFFKKFRIWLYLIKNLNLFKNADLVHAHDVFIWYLPLRLILFNKMVFVTFHGYEGKFPPDKRAVQIRSMSNKLSHGSINVGAFIQKWYGTKPDYVTYGGINKLKSTELAVRNREVKSKLKIVLVGRLERDIGIQVYIDALKKLKEKGVKFTLKVVGDGSYRKQLELYGVVVGFQKNVKPYIKDADVVFSSSYLLMLESLQLGKQVLCAYSNPLKHDYLHNSPFSPYVSISNNGPDLAKMLMRGGNKEKISKGQKWANTQTWSKLSDMYLELWSKKYR